MPDGGMHRTIWAAGCLTLPALTIGSALLTDALPMAYTCGAGGCLSGQTFLAAGVFAGYAVIGQFLDPDLDIVGITQSEGRMMNKLSIFGYILVGYWTIYGAIFRRAHRSFWTHGPLVSTLIRYLYQFWPLAFLIYKGWWNQGATYFLIGMYTGTSIADILHWAADILSGETHARNHGQSRVSS